MASGTMGFRKGRRSRPTCSVAPAPALTQAVCSRASMPASPANTSGRVERAGTLLMRRAYRAGDTGAVARIGALPEGTPRMDFDRYDRIRPIRWQGDHLSLLDQRRLPAVVEYVECADSDAVATAIRDLVVRGAPAIGIAAAWGAVLAGQTVQAANGDDAVAAM